jgi:translation initiation factor 3 subunit B
MESGYAVWDFKGVELQKHQLDKFKQFLWRPRPPTLLSREQQRTIKRNLREYARQFEEQDQLDASNVSSELVALRKRLVEEWNAWRRASKEMVERRRVELGKETKGALKRSEEAEKNADEVVEEWVEEVVSETVEVIA